MDFTLINKDFMELYKDRYFLIDIKEADFIPSLSKVLICFVVKTDRDKSKFLKERYNMCCKDYLSFIN